MTTSIIQRFSIPDGNRLSLYLKDALNAQPRSLYLGTKEALGSAIAQAYERGFQGAFVAGKESPTWARQVGEYHRDSFIRNTKVPFFDQSSAYIQGASAGVDRVCNWNYGMRYNADYYKYFQDYGSCVFASKTKGVFQLLTTRISQMEKSEVVPAPISVAGYAERGHCGEGTSVGLSAEFFMDGIPFRMKYLDDKYDLTDEDKDESLAQNTWCRSGIPDDLRAEFRKYKFGNLSYMNEVSVERVKDVLASGGIIDTGANATIGGSPNPISFSSKRIGGHCQVFGGYDDSQELKDRYKADTGTTLNECVLFMHQSWGPNWIKVSNWYTDLWGDRPEGMVPATYSAAKAILDEVYAWYPDAEGYTAPIVWSN